MMFTNIMRKLTIFVISIACLFLFANSNTEIRQFLSNQYLTPQQNTTNTQTSTPTSNIIISDDGDSEIFEKTSPAVVLVLSKDEYNQPLGRGSGVFISSDGKVLTNFHVIENATHVFIKTMDGIEYAVAGLSAANKETDYVILQSTASQTPFVITGSSEG